MKVRERQGYGGVAGSSGGGRASWLKQPQRPMWVADWDDEGAHVREKKEDECSFECMSAC